VKYVVLTTNQPVYPQFLQHPDRFSQVFKRDTVVVFENKTALPRAFVVGAGGVQVIQGNMEQIDALKRPSFDPMRSVVLDSLPEELAGVPPGAEFTGSVEILDSNINGYHFRVQTSTPSILVVSQNFYPGWKATVSGRSASVFPADHALTGIAVPAGNHEIRFEFQPSSFKLGALLSLISATLLGVLLVPIRSPSRLRGGGL